MPLTDAVYQNMKNKFTITDSGTSTFIYSVCFTVSSNHPIVCATTIYNTQQDNISGLYGSYTCWQQMQGLTIEDVHLDAVCGGLP